MAESSLVSQLGLKPDQTLLILQAPDGYFDLLGALPEGVQVHTQAQGVYDFVHLFVYNKADIETLALEAIQAVKPGGQLWFAYPKKTGAIKTDITRDSGWDSVVRAGWDGVRQIAIDDTWSAVRFRPMDEIKRTTGRTGPRIPPK